MSHDPVAAAHAIADRAVPAAHGSRTGRWLRELGRVPTGLAEAYLPGTGGINARTREQLILVVSEVNGERWTRWVHGAWTSFLGRRDPEEALLPLLAYARTCAEARAPLDTTTLDAVYPAAVVRSVRATVAHAELANVVGASVDDALARLSRRRRFAPGAIARDAAVVGVALPLAMPTLALAGAMAAVARLAPKVPEIELPPAHEANLVAHLLAEAAPTYLGHVAARTSLVWSPVPIAIAFRSEGQAATIRVGRGRVAVTNGVEPGALLIVDGGIEPLLQTVAGSILRELGGPLRRR